MRAWAYLAAYVLALTWPLAFVAISDAGRDLSAATVLSDSIGFVALNALALQFVVPSRAQPMTTPFGMQALLRFHRFMGAAALVFALVHLGLLFVANASETLRLFVVHDAPNRARAAMIGLVSLVALTALSFGRARHRIPYEAWRFLHIALGLAALAGSFVHALLVARFTQDPALRWGSFAMLALAAIAVFYLRFARPFGAGWAPYRLTSVVRETTDVATLVLEPEGRERITFHPGQFAWLKLADARYSLREHPFSFSSSAMRADEVRFTIRSAGDFSASITALQPGTRILVDGPHGGWRMPSHGQVTFVTGGVGVTPALSALATALDGGTDLPIQVVYACRTMDDVINADLLTTARDHPMLDVHVLPTTAPRGWLGPSGYVSSELLASLPGLPLAERSWFVCGPPAMLEATTSALTSLGVPSDRIHVESF